MNENFREGFEKVAIGQFTIQRAIINRLAKNDPKKVLNLPSGQHTVGKTYKAMHGNVAHTHPKDFGDRFLDQTKDARKTALEEIRAFNKQTK